jgi:hypothetical protein
VCTLALSGMVNTPAGVRMARLAGQAGGDADQDAVSTNEDELLRDRDDDGDRPFRCAPWVPDELTGLETATPSRFGVLSASAAETVPRQLASNATPAPKRVMADLRTRPADT